MRIRLFKILVLLILSVYLTGNAYALPERTNNNLPISSKFIFIPEDLSLTFPSDTSKQPIIQKEKNNTNEAPASAPSTLVRKENLPIITPAITAIAIAENTKETKTENASEPLNEGGYLSLRKPSIKQGGLASFSDKIEKMQFDAKEDTKTISDSLLDKPKQADTKLASSTNTNDILEIPNKEQISSVISSNLTVTETVKKDAPTPILAQATPKIPEPVSKALTLNETAKQNVKSFDDKETIASLDDNIFYIPVEKSGFAQNDKPLFPSVPSEKHAVENTPSQIAYQNNNSAPTPEVANTIARAENNAPMIIPVEPKNTSYDRDYSKITHGTPWKIAKTAKRASLANKNYDNITQNSEQLASVWTKLPAKDSSIDMPEVDGTLLVHNDDEQNKKSTDNYKEKMIKLSDYDVSVAQLEKENNSSSLINVADKASSIDDFPILEKMPDDDIPSLGDLPPISENESSSDDKKSGKIGDLVTSITSIFGNDSTGTVKEGDETSSPGILEKINQKISSAVKSEEKSSDKKSTNTNAAKSSSGYKKPKMKGSNSVETTASSYILPTEMRLSFQPDMASISGQTLKWFYKFTQKAKEDSDTILEIRMSAQTPYDLKSRRGAIISNILKSSNLSESKVRMLYTDRAPNTLVLRLIKSYDEAADTNRTFYQNNTYKQW